MDSNPRNPTPFNARITTLLDPTGSSNILAGHKDIGSVDGDSDLSADAVGGYLWDEAVRAGKSLRHYGFYTDYTYYFVPPPLFIPISRTPFADRIPQGPALRPTLRRFNDIYYRGFDMSVPDSYHYEEWKREFDQYVANRNLPALELLSLPLDHFGSFGGNVGGLNTPELQMQTTISRWDALFRPSRIHLTGRTPRSSSWRTTRRTVPTTWMRTAPRDM